LEHRISGIDRRTRRGVLFHSASSRISFKVVDRFSFVLLRFSRTSFASLPPSPGPGSLRPQVKRSTRALFTSSRSFFLRVEGRRSSRGAGGARIGCGRSAAQSVLCKPIICLTCARRTWAKKDTANRTSFAWAAINGSFLLSAQLWFNSLSSCPVVAPVLHGRAHRDHGDDARLLFSNLPCKPNCGWRGFRFSRSLLRRRRKRLRYALFVVLFLVATAMTVRYVLSRAGAGQGRHVDDGIRKSSRTPGQGRLPR